MEGKDEDGEYKCEHGLQRRAVQHHVDGRRRRCDERRKRGDSRNGRDRKPRCNGKQTDRPCQGEHNAKESGHALAAAEA